MGPADVGQPMPFGQADIGPPIILGAADIGHTFALHRAAALGDPLLLAHLTLSRLTYAIGRNRALANQSPWAG